MAEVDSFHRSLRPRWMRRCGQSPAGGAIGRRWWGRGTRRAQEAQRMFEQRRKRFRLALPGPLYVILREEKMNPPRYHEFISKPLGRLHASNTHAYLPAGRPLLPSPSTTTIDIDIDTDIHLYTHTLPPSCSAHTPPRACECHTPTFLPST